MKKITILLLIAVVLTATIQCSKRENPVDPDYPQGLLWNLSFESQSVLGDMMLDPPARDVLVYTPPGYDPEGAATYPVLYLLHGYGGDNIYFKTLFGLQDAMDELIYNGEVEPMIVVTPDAGNALGGSFYTNSFAYPDTLAAQPDTTQSYAGLMQNFITDEVVPLIDSLFHTDPVRQNRGIAGHSMGGYGAIKLAMLRADMFGSAASMSGPLAFWGDYNPADPGSATFLGILELLPFVYAENGFTPGDTTAFYNIAPGPGKSLSNMMFAMGAAFSPHHPSDPDTTYAHLFVSEGTGFVGKIDLPFGADGEVALPIWNRWMANDVTALYSGGYGPALANTDIYVDCGAEDDLALYGHALVFQAVAGDDIDQFEVYGGFEDIFVPDHSTFIGERLRGVLKFHSDSFTQ
ncbi:MAG: alpha/beta hydrolase-fold protein [candidate division Zixibacteria bacterium]